MISLVTNFVFLLLFAVMRDHMLFHIYSCLVSGEMGLEISVFSGEGTVVFSWLSSVDSLLTI